MSHSQHLQQQCPRCRMKGHYVLECPNVKPLDEKCTMLTRALTSEQSEELQEIINKNFYGSLHEEQIPAALDFILEVIEHIITKDEEYLIQKDKGYNERPCIRNYYEAKVKKVKRKAFKHCQKLANQDHIYETNDL
ncbi:hypothetical protein F8M41_001148 [Gigaspora margarita]|uniref:CCHC-type domain-containing protein n=1 Tax=Gigaspora margarita TaxID=4874 RepID=A0A8H3XFL0_GIGMA|nr:hypothetical protein F8M41_001148 [Gigaspora margarita]